jgi:hypothetical protein
MHRHATMTTRGRHDAAGAAVSRDVNDRRRQLAQRWHKADVVDRLAAVERFLRDEALNPDVRVVLRERHEQLEQTWTAARLARVHGDLLRARQLELELRLGEMERDTEMVRLGLEDELLAAAEGFLVDAPRRHGAPTFEDLLADERWRNRPVVRFTAPVIDRLDDEELRNALPRSLRPQAA